MFEDPMGIAGRGLRGMGDALDTGVTSPVVTTTEATAGTTKLNFWGKVAQVSKNVASALATTVGAVSPAVTSIIQQKTADKLAQTESYRQQLAAGQQPTFPAGTTKTASKIPTWLVPTLIGGGLLVGGILLLGRKKGR